MLLLDKLNITYCDHHFEYESYLYSLRYLQQFTHNVPQISLNCRCQHSRSAVSRG